MILDNLNQKGLGNKTNKKDNSSLEYLLRNLTVNKLKRNAHRI
jgi:hypothetical protein